ncbi:MAG: TlpA family protein disulfide reductase [Acidobacteriota bacterium]|nr:TlpA family protein disulfide reductase [Acidobacteriota bacterium]MDQ5873101.1 TlpA family protein disulfide reductase [Acidobacteriota bacterium]
MTALEPGEAFREIELETEAGDRFVHPGIEALYGFFKTTCPTSELAWPHFDRIRRIGEGGLRTFAVSQDGRAETREFNARLGVGLETLYDPEPWKASAALGLTNVPTFFLVGSHGRIRETVVGFQRQRLEELARRAGKLAGRPPVRLFPIGEHIPLIVPG